MNKEVEITGLGWRCVPSEKSVYLLFEVAGVVKSLETGELQPAGLLVKIGPNGIRKDFTLHKISERLDLVVKTFLEKGITPAGIKGNQLTAITWQKYLEKGYDTK
jgi:hypothetical protein